MDLKIQLPVLYGISQSSDDNWKRLQLITDISKLCKLKYGTDFCVSIPDYSLKTRHTQDIWQKDGSLPYLKSINLPVMVYFTPSAISENQIKAIAEILEQWLRSLGRPNQEVIYVPCLMINIV